jgi:hypothetical protein
VTAALHRYLVTAETRAWVQLWTACAQVTNWIEGRGPQDRQTWLVMCPGKYAGGFLHFAGEVGATVEEIEGAGDSEQYVLRAGEPGTGWQR